MHAQQVAAFASDPFPDSDTNGYGSSGANSSLEHLSVTGCSLTGGLPTWLRRSLSRLKSVDLSSNMFSGTLPEMWGGSQLPALELVRGQGCEDGGDEESREATKVPLTVTTLLLPPRHPAAQPEP